MDNTRVKYKLDITEHTINLREIVARKDKKMAQRIPGIVYWLLGKIIHLRLINQSIWNNRDRNGADFTAHMLKEFGIETKVNNSKNLPKGGRHIIVANHPLGGPDGMAIIKEFSQINGKIIGLSNDFLMFLPRFDQLFVPVNKVGKNTDNAKLIDDAFASDENIFIFPAGLVSRKMDDGSITDLDWKVTFVSKAIKYQRDIIPVYVDGKNKRFFYSFARWRKRMKIKANLEMLLLPDQMFRFRNRTISMTVGKTIPYTTFDKSKNIGEWVKVVRTYVYGLAEDKDLEFKKN